MIIIRQLTASDSELYWALRLEALKQYPEAFLTSYEDAIKRKEPLETVARMLSQEGNYIYGAFEGDDLIGLITLQHESTAKIRHRATIYALYVSGMKQGKGVGKALVTVAIEKARCLEEIEKINLSVTSANEPAKRLYLELGFQTFGFEEKAIKVGNTYYANEHMVLHL